MNVYDSLKDLYELETVENEVLLSKNVQTIDDTVYCGFTAIIKGEKYFIHQLLDVNGNMRTMGSKWTVYNLTRSKYTLSGVKTKKETIQFLKNI